MTAIEIGPRKLENKLREKGKAKKVIRIEKKETVKKFGSGARVTDLTCTACRNWPS